MISIRRKVFETNSSSCHTITMARKEVFEKLRSHKYIYTGEIEHHDDCQDYYTEIDEDLIKPIEEVIEDYKELIDKEIISSMYIDEIKEKFYKLYNSKASEDEFYKFIICERFAFEDILHYEIADTDWVLALNKNIEEETNNVSKDSWLEEEYVPNNSKEDTVVRKVKVLC